MTERKLLRCIGILLVFTGFAYACLDIAASVNKTAMSGRDAVVHVGIGLICLYLGKERDRE